MTASSTSARLAIDGGKPVRSTRLPYGHQAIDQADIDAVIETLRSNFLTTGPRVSEFEEAFAEAVGARYAVAVSSGTAALHAASFVAGLRPGTEAITTPLTFAATANCVRYVGGTVVFADVRSETLTIDPNLVERAVTTKTRAIIPVDYAGRPADLDDLLSIAERHGLTVIEDACHAFGARYRGRKVGNLAHLTVFSLHPVKHLTTGEGGVVTTDDPDFAARLRRFRSHGIDRDGQTREHEGSWWYEMVELGFNYRITDFQCALGLAQLRKTDSWLVRRQLIAARYDAAFADLQEVDLLVPEHDREHAYHLYVIRLRLERLNAGRAQIFKALIAENIGVNVHYIPVPWHPYYRGLGYSPGAWPVAEAAYERILSLPMFPSMSDGDVQDVVEAVQKVIRHYAA